MLSDSLRQRCLIHRVRNILAKVSKHAQGQVKAEYWAIFDDIEAAPGKAAISEVTGRPTFAATWRPLPSTKTIREEVIEETVTPAA